MLSTTMRKPLVPMVPPPQLPPQNRFHLVNQASTQPQKQQLLTFSASSSSSTSNSSSSSTTSSSSSSPAGGCTTSGESQTLSNKKRAKQQAKKAKKYEKLLTVKSHDSAATTTTSIDSHTTSSSHTHILTKLLTNKVTLQPFIDQFVETIFTNTGNLPPVVQHLFEFFDLEAKKYQSQMTSGKETSKNSAQYAAGGSDEMSQVTRMWKTNSFFMRYWINLVKNPEFLLQMESTTSSPVTTTTNTVTNQTWVMPNLFETI